MTIGIVPNGMKCEFNAIQNGIPIVNRVFVTTPSAPTTTDMNNLITAAVDFYQSLLPFQHPSYIMQNITVTDVHVANGTQIIAAQTSGNVGAAPGVPAAANAAQVVSLRTAFTGRSFRGRYYVGGLAAVNQSDAQNWTTAQSVSLSGLFQDFITALDAVGQTLVVVSNFAAGVVRVVALATEIIALITDTKVDSQRRRTAN